MVQGRNQDLVLQSIPLPDLFQGLNHSACTVGGMNILPESVHFICFEELGPMEAVTVSQDSLSSKGGD
jgi:hypothetical protein